ncbi:MAG TPA: hypothetical protein VGE07_16640 [Herpetosiphonaceae bacterium]
MATIAQSQSPKRWQPWTLPWLGRQLLLVPETVILPVIFGAHLLAGGALAVAVLGELVIALFVLRTLLLWAAGRALDGGSYARARRLSRLALRLHPWSADAEALAGAVELAEGQAEAALGRFSRAAALFPGHGPLYVRMGAALIADNDLGEARWAALQALACDDKQPGAYTLLAEVTLRGSNNGVTARELAQRGLAFAATAHAQAPLYTVLAEAQAVVGDLDAAGMAVEQAELLLPLCPVPLQAELLYRLGTVRRQLGDRDRARADFLLVEEIDPRGRFVAPAWRARVETKAA